KYMKITLRERNGGMYISSIQSVDGQEVIGSMPATRAPEIETATETPAVPTLPEIQTSAVAVTDKDGEEVTDASGVAVTEIVTIVPETVTGEETTTEPITEIITGESITEEE
ncbi:MAG: hypothetical protein J6R20_09120, partial [Clostridia bacterium]|nr:hypothetical protein [Clostridia bacterium]